MKEIRLERVRRNFFIRHFIQFLTPALLSVLIIGSLAYGFAYGEVIKYVEDNNTSMLDNAIHSIQSVMKEVEQININLSTNSSIKERLKRILSNRPLILTADDHTAFRTIMDMIFVSANLNQNVHSIYIYFESAKDLFIVSKEKNIYSLDSFADRSWQSSYVQHRDGAYSSWVEKRSIAMQSSDVKSVPVLTLYNKTYSLATGHREADGVLVLNIYMDSINSLIDSMIRSPGQMLLVVNEDHQLIFSSKNASALSDELISQAETAPYVHDNMHKYAVTKQPFTMFGWTAISLTPYTTLYRIPNQIVFSTVLGFILSMIASTCFALYTTHRAYINFSNLLTIIELSKKDESVSDIQPPSTHNGYHYIIHNLLKTFMERDYLTMQKKYRMQTLELQAMQAQINPHFLLNTMETIYWKSMSSTGQPNEMSAIIEDISSILQYSLYDPMQVVPLVEETDIAKSYLNVQKIRHERRFTVEWQIRSDLLHYKVNKLILQSILENAIYHGYRDQEHVLRIRIRIERFPEALGITITDNGCGIPAAHLKQIRQTLSKVDSDFSAHIGLYNTHKRIQLMHGAPYGLRISSLHQIGTSVRIEMPLID